MLSLQVAAASSLSTSSSLVIVINKVVDLWGRNYLEGWAPENLSYRLNIWEGKGGELETTGDRYWYNARAMRFNLRGIRASSWQGDEHLR
jgi:hypothetical protein